MERKQLQFILDTKDRVQCVIIKVKEEFHCTADIRLDYRNSDKITIVTSKITSQHDDQLSLYDQMMELTEKGIYYKVEVMAELLYEAFEHYTYHLVTHPLIARLKFK